LFSVALSAAEGSRVRLQLLLT